MITKLYLNNYKGFSDTIIPIKEINFLVGDNSTGKTTVMNLLYIIDHLSIPFKIDLNEEIRLGSFTDIVNQYSSDKSYFAFGCEKIVGKKKTYHYWKFGNNNGVAFLQEYKHYKRQANFRMVKGGKIQLSVETGVKEEEFEEWVHITEEPKYKEIKNDSKEMKEVLFKVLFEDNGDFINNFVENSMLRFSPVRAQAKPYYDNYDREFTPDGNHVATFLKKCIERKEGKYENILKTINEFGRESSLFEEVDIEKLNDGDTSPFSVDMKYGKAKVNISNVGFGVSQVMPLIVEMLRRKKTQIAIPQPEVHLHPKAQCAFGTFVFRNWMHNNNRYLLETHSEYMINRFRYEMQNSEKKPKGKSQVLFFERTENGDIVTPMPIGTDGRFINDVPDSYGDFFVDEDLKMLSL